MKKKGLLTAIIAIIVLAIPFSVFAATSGTTTAKKVRGFFGIDVSKLTEQQKSDVLDYSQKMADLQKSFINKMVENGTLTKEQGDAEIQRIDNALKNSGGMGMLFGKGGRDKGMMGIDVSKLTAQQKTELQAVNAKMANLQKEYITKSVANGLITKTQGDNAAKQVDNMLEAMQESGLNAHRGLMKGFGEFKFFGFGSMDQTALTEQQKKDLSDYNTKMTELKKEYIDKLVNFGLITQQQGDMMKNDTSGMMGMWRGGKGFHGKGRQ